MHRSCQQAGKGGALFFEEKFRSERNLCAVAENTLILANNPLLQNFSFCKNPIVIGFFGKKTEPQFCIKITVQIWVQGADLNHRPPGYEPDELPDCSTPRRQIA